MLRHGARGCTCTSSKRTACVISVLTGKVFTPSLWFFGKFCLTKDQEVNCDLNMSFFNVPQQQTKMQIIICFPEIPWELSHSEVQLFQFLAFLPELSDLNVQLILLICRWWYLLLFINIVFNWVFLDFSELPNEHKYLSSTACTCNGLRGGKDPFSQSQGFF